MRALIEQQESLRISPEIGARALIAGSLEGLARAYFDCQETCPAVRPGMVVPDGTDRSPAGRAAVQAAAARLWLAAAARTALGAGLGLLGVGAPDRL